MAQRKANRPRSAKAHAAQTAHPQARFWRKFLRLTRGRIPVLKALEVIVEEETHPVLRVKLGTVLQAMERGAVMSEALAGVTPCFSLSAVELVRSAEKSGAWDEILLEIAEGLEEGTFDDIV